VAVTERYEALHNLTPAQARAACAVASGETHEAAGNLAGVHRVTVTRWSHDHPAFRAEVNRLRAEAAAQARRKVRDVTEAAIALIGKAVEEGDLQAAFTWLKLVPFTTVTTATNGPTEADGIIEAVRTSMPSRLEVVPDALAWTTQEAEGAIADRLSGLLPSDD
jgi:hypothetical protein